MTPGQRDRAESELVAAAESLREASVLLGLHLYRGTASRLYYAVFHAARAALTIRGLAAKTHAGQLNVFVRTFGPAPEVGRLLQMRLGADYRSDEFEADATQLRDLLGEAEAFVERCRAIVHDADNTGPNEPDPPRDL